MSVREGEFTSSDKVVKQEEKFNTFHLAAFIVCTVIGREYSNWQPGLSQGFGQFLIAEIVVAMAFLNYFFCLSEIWSAVPFSGGGYGLSRALIGFCPGFLVGCAEVFVYVSHAANGALFLSNAICAVSHTDPNATLGIVVAVYLLALGLCLKSDAVTLRNSYIVLALISVAILTMWLLGSLKYSDFATNASLHKDPAPDAIANWFDGGMAKFVTLFTFSSLPYAGVKSFTLMVPYAKEPKTDIPRSAYVVFFIFALNMFVVFVNAAQPGGILVTSALPMPMAVGFRLMFNTTKEVAVKVTAFLSFPAAFAKTFSYLVPCGLLLQSFGKTNLLPNALRLNNNKDHKHGMLVSTVMSFLICLLIIFDPTFDLYGLCILFTVFSNVCVIYCYIALKLNCPKLERGFVNPLGVSGAVFSALVFLLLGISSGFMQGDYQAIFFFIGLMVIWTVYYYGFAAKRQTLCKEEDRVFMMLHVRNFNRIKKSKHRSNNNKNRSPRVWSFSGTGSNTGGGGGSKDHSSHGSQSNHSLNSQSNHGELSGTASHSLGRSLTLKKNHSIVPVQELIGIHA